MNLDIYLITWLSSCICPQILGSLNTSSLLSSVSSDLGVAEELDAANGGGEGGGIASGIIILLAAPALSSVLGSLRSIAKRVHCHSSSDDIVVVYKTHVIAVVWISCVVQLSLEKPCGL